LNDLINYLCDNKYYIIDLKVYLNAVIKDRLTNLGKRYISIAEGRSEPMELLVSE